MAELNERLLGPSRWRYPIAGIAVLAVLALAVSDTSPESISLCVGAVVGIGYFFWRANNAELLIDGDDVVVKNGPSDVHRLSRASVTAEIAESKAGEAKEMFLGSIWYLFTNQKSYRQIDESQVRKSLVITSSDAPGGKVTVRAAFGKSPKRIAEAIAKLEATPVA